MIARLWHRAMVAIGVRAPAHFLPSDLVANDAAIKRGAGAAIAASFGQPQ